MVLAVHQYDCRQGIGKLKASREERTVSVILEVEKLIVPLGHDPYGIFHKRADDEESSSCRYVSTASKWSSQQELFLLFNPLGIRSGNA